METPKSVPEADEIMEGLRGKGIFHWSQDPGNADYLIPIHTECGGQIREIDRGERSNRVYQDKNGNVVAALGDGPWEFFEWDCDECGPIDLIDPPDIKEWY